MKVEGGVMYGVDDVRTGYVRGHDIPEDECDEVDGWRIWFKLSV